MSEQTSDWKKVEGVLVARRGTKDPWFELLITKPDGSQKKLIARKVDRFYSEKTEGEL